MKKMIAALSLVAALSAPAFARSYSIVVESKMSQQACSTTILSTLKNLERSAGGSWTAQMWGHNDYYVLHNGEHAGNAYYSEGTCYIYVK